MALQLFSQLLQRRLLPAAPLPTASTSAASAVCRQSELPTASLQRCTYIDVFSLNVCRSISRVARGRAQRGERDLQVSGSSQRGSPEEQSLQTYTSTSSAVCRQSEFPTASLQRCIYIEIFSFNACRCISRLQRSKRGLQVSGSSLRGSLAGAVPTVLHVYSL